jgi:hypothetical protein
MKRWILALCLALLFLPSLGTGTEKEGLSPAVGSVPVLEVSALMREGDGHKGPVRVEGVVSRVFPKEQKLGLIDAAEFKRCGVVTCADLTLPVQWSGPMPEVKSLVRLEGEIQKSGQRLEFVAKSLEKVQAK